MKLPFRLIVVIVAGMVFGIAGWTVGAYIGGNFAVDFTFNGIRGYEALGQLGSIFGSIGGSVLCWLILSKQYRK